MTFFSTPVLLTREAAMDGDEEIRELVDTSYDLVVSKLPKSKRP